MSALSAFDIAARTGNFSRAAREADLTQGAISRQIANLEEWIGAPLFVRHGRGLTLTPTGRLYADEISGALERIREATRGAMASTAPRKPLSVATLPGFGARWLGPRLPSLLKASPSITLNFSARPDHVDFNAEPFDAAIRFGDGRWPGVLAERLFDEEMAPVCTPALAQDLRTPKDIAALALMGVPTRPLAWRQWFQRADAPVGEIRPSLMFEHFMMLTEATLSGSGVALIPTFLIEQELSRGLLVQPFDITLKTDAAYYLTYPPELAVSDDFIVFRDWLISQSRLYEAELRR